MEVDVILVGGGLQNGLIALAVLAEHPRMRVAMIERGGRLGGNHTWSFHDTDVPEDARAWVEPLVVARWTGWEVAFPGLRRAFEGGYASIDSARLHAVVVEAMARSAGGRLLTNARAASVEAHEVVLDDGRTLRAPLVVDARGPDRRAVRERSGWQKFLGLELAIDGTSPLTRPLLMDATVEQTDGFRFFYALPLAPDRVLVEETWFSDTASLDEMASRRAVIRYAAELGLAVRRVVREEHGALPLPLSSGPAPSASSPLVGGFHGGFFHPTTGYSLPVAVRVARHVAKTIDAPGGVFGPEWRALLDAHARQVRFATMLNRLLFEATEPQHRRDVLERFHKLPESTVLRFYALETTPGDRARVICGRPPRGVSLRAALSNVTRMVIS